MATLTPIPSILTTEKYRHLALQALQVLAGTVGTNGLEIANDSGNPIPTKDHNAAASGSTFFNDTTARTGNWYCIQVLANTVFTTLTDSTRGGTAISTFSFPAGTVFFGNFTAITLASGTIIAYAV
jgi:hypothetical protein